MTWRLQVGIYWRLLHPHLWHLGWDGSDVEPNRDCGLGHPMWPLWMLGLPYMMAASRPLLWWLVALAGVFQPASRSYTSLRTQPVSLTASLLPHIGPPSFKQGEQTAHLSMGGPWNSCVAMF